MNNMICSEGFKNFFNMLQGDNVTFASIQKMLPDALAFVSDELHLGKVEVMFTAPASAFEPMGKTDRGACYIHPNGFENTPYSEEFTIGPNGQSVLTAYPQKGYTWSAAELEEISFLLKNIFLICSRSRLTGLMRETILTDDLTGVLNSAGLMRFAGMLQAKNELSHFTGLFLNIKNFKYINQRASSRQANLILRKYAFFLRQNLLPDEICARLGGDNFFLLVKNERLDAFFKCIGDVRISTDSADAPLTFDIHARIGIYPIKEGDNINDVMSYTSIALAIAKNSLNHDYMWFTPQHMEKILHDKEISNLFPTAIKTGEFIVYYQPKVELPTNRICGCEALVRWIRNGQIVPPMDFIPVLEKEGTICDLDFYVLDAVCQDIRRWLDKGIEPVCVSVNFSKVHLHNQMLAEAILAVLTQYHIDSKYIEIELTEMSGYEDFDALSSFVDTMKEHGINTSIDDFGTGYSSLNLLKDLNVDIIKLDKSFLHNISKQNESDEIVIKTMINMIKALHMDVIAEGVETLEQASFLSDSNCCMAQGFLFDKPLPREDFEQRLLGERVYTFEN